MSRIKNTTGSILPLCLAVIVILSICASATYFSAHEVLRLIGEFSKNSNAILANNYQKYLLPKNPKIAGIIDYHSILSEAKNCTAISSRPSKTSFGFNLSSAAVVASSDCELTEKLLVADGNLISEQAVDISGLANQKVAAAGYIDLSKSLRVSGEVTVISGGDMRINELIAVTKTSVTLVSGTGFIYLPSVQGDITIAAYGLLGSSIAPEAKIGANLAIPLLKRFSLGLLPPNSTE